MKAVRSPDTGQDMAPRNPALRSIRAVSLRASRPHQRFRPVAAAARIAPISWRGGGQAGAGGVAHRVTPIGLFSDIST